MYNPDRGSSSEFNNRNSNQQNPRAGASSKLNDEDNRRERDRPSKRNRWDESNNGDSHSRGGGGSGYRRQRERSRSPVRNSTSDCRNVQRTEGLNPSRNNNASSNWSDSSSDDEKKSYRRGSGGYGNGNNNNNNGRRDEERSSSNSRWDKRSDGGSGRRPEESQYGRKDVNFSAEPQMDLKEAGGEIVGNVSNPLEIKSLNNNLEIGKGPVGALPAKISTGIQMKLLTQLKPATALTPTSVKPKANIASVFNVDDDDEPEEMPPECKMRMKNVGRETPTSAGPNSFGKTKIGFCNVIQIKERKIQEQLQKK